MTFMLFKSCFNNVNLKKFKCTFLYRFNKCFIQERKEREKGARSERRKKGRE